MWVIVEMQDHIVLKNQAFIIQVIFLIYRIYLLQDVRVLL